MRIIPMRSWKQFLSRDQGIKAEVRSPKEVLAAIGGWQPGYFLLHLGVRPTQPVWRGHSCPRNAGFDTNVFTTNNVEPVGKSRPSLICSLRSQHPPRPPAFPAAAKEIRSHRE